MLKAREILRLKNEFDFSIREVARASDCGKTTVYPAKRMLEVITKDVTMVRQFIQMA